MRRREDVDPEDEAAIAEMENSFATPEARAAEAAKIILYLLTAVPHWSAEEREAQRQYLSSQGGPLSVWSDFYGMPEASRDLEAKPPSGKTMEITARLKPIAWSKS
jgi:hypothetical protein